jgi:hypothetical protein
MLERMTERKIEAAKPRGLPTVSEVLEDGAIAGWRDPRAQAFPGADAPWALRAGCSVTELKRTT